MVINHKRLGILFKLVKSQPIGKNTLSGIVKTVYTALGIRGEGASDYVTTHGLRATMISLIISSGHSNASVELRSGHRNNNSLQSCHNLMGSSGGKQLSVVFGGDASSKPKAPLIPSTASLEDKPNVHVRLDRSRVARKKPRKKILKLRRMDVSWTCSMET